MGCSASAPRDDHDDPAKEPTPIPPLAKEQGASTEQAAAELAAKELAATEQAEQAAKEKAVKEQADKEQADKELAAAEQVAKELAAAADQSPQGRAAFRFKLVLKTFEAKVSSGFASALGPPDIKPKLTKLDELPDRIEDVEDGLDDISRDADMRLLPIATLLSWDYLHVYEDVKPEECLQMPYKDVTDEIWSTSLAFSWRWSKEKPETNTALWSPASTEQWEELQALLRHADSNGMQHAWIDWSCMPQYSAGMMTEVLRSKVYYVRAASMIVLPTLNPLPGKSTVLIVLKRALKVLRQRAKQATSDADPQAGVAEAAVAAVLEVLLEKKLVAGREYFGRAWTLAERMARYGRKERLSQWLSLEAWLGMVVDAMLKSTEDHQESRIYQKMLGKEASDLLNDLLVPLASAIEDKSMHDKAAESLPDKVALLCLMAAEIWCNAVIPEEAPSLEWLCSYLNQEVPSGMYKAFDNADLLWAVYSYFIYERPQDKTDERVEAALEAALNALAQLSLKNGFQPAGFRKYPWSAATYRSLGLVDAAAAQEEVMAGFTKPGAIVAAAGSGDFDVLKLCLDLRPSEVNEVQVNSDGWTALHAAIHSQHGPSMPMVSLLLDRGAYVHKAFRGKWTVLSAAAGKNRTDIVALLLDHGADILNAHPADKAYEATPSGESTSGWTALHSAAEHGGKDTVAQLLDLGADIYKATGAGMTPLLCAAESGDSGTVSLLLDRGARIQDADQDGKTALYKAAVGALKSAPYEYRLRDNPSEAERAERAAWIAERDAWAAERIRHEDVAALLLDRGADTNKVANDGISVLQLAARAQSANARFVSLLLDGGADVLKADNDGKTTLHDAAYAAHGDVDNVRIRVDIMSMLLRGGADVNKADKDGKTVLHVALKDKGEIEVIEKQVALLLTYGPDIHAADNEGKTILHYAAGALAFTSDRKHIRQLENIVIKLLGLGAATGINKASNDGKTALHYAAAKHHGDIVEVLLKRGADSKLVDNAGKTARTLCEENRRSAVNESWYSATDRKFR